MAKKWKKRLTPIYSSRRRKKKNTKKIRHLKSFGKGGGGGGRDWNYRGEKGHLSRGRKKVQETLLNVRKRKKTSRRKRGGVHKR